MNASDGSDSKENTSYELIFHLSSHEGPHGAA